MDIPERESRHGSPTFYSLLEEMANTHDAKSHDYASDKNPSGNYHFAGQVSAMFAHSPEDAGFVGRIAEKIYRLANLEGGQKTPRNESIADTEKDICVITCLWMADRRDRRRKNLIGLIDNDMKEGLKAHEKSQDTMSQMIQLNEALTPEDRQQMIDYLRACLRDDKANAQMGQANQHLGASLGIGLQGPQRR